MATNRKLPSDLSERIKKDSLACNRSILSITQLALEAFYRRPLAERRAVIELSPRTRSGRKAK